MSTLPEPGLSIEQFEAGQVDAEQFDHEAHVHIAWLYVRTYGLAEALSRFDDALRRLTRKLGVPGKYHATITWLYMVLINERRKTDEPWAVFYQNNPDLIGGSKATLQRYYSEARLFSDAAREHFVLPDKIAA